MNGAKLFVLFPLPGFIVCVTTAEENYNEVFNLLFLFQLILASMKIFIVTVKT